MQCEVTLELVLGPILRGMLGSFHLMVVVTVLALSFNSFCPFEFLAGTVLGRCGVHVGLCCGAGFRGSCWAYFGLIMPGSFSMTRRQIYARVISPSPGVRTNHAL